MKSTLILLAALVLAGIVPAQDKTRELKREGITFTLPGTWAWQSDFGSNLAIKMSIAHPTGPHEILGELLSNDDLTVDDEIAKLQAKVKAGGPDFREFGVDKAGTLGGAKAVIVRFLRVRNEGKEISEERTYLQRRGTLLLTWREENRKEVGNAASLAFSAARGAMTFKEGTAPKLEPPRVWKDLGLKITLPEAWKWVAERHETQEQGSALLSVMQGDVVVKKGEGFLNMQVSAQKYTATLQQLVDSNKDKFTEGIDGATNMSVDSKSTFRGEKAAYVTFQGSLKGTKYNFRRWYVKRKTNLVVFQMLTPPGDDPAIAAAVKKAEASVTFN